MSDLQGRLRAQFKKVDIEGDDAEQLRVAVEEKYDATTLESMLADLEAGRAGEAMATENRRIAEEIIVMARDLGVPVETALRMSG